MSKSRRTYTREFKLEALAMWQTSGKSAAQVERELGIGDSCLSRWKAALQTDGENAFSGPGHLKPHQETIRQLKREIAIVRLEMAIIRKGEHFLDEKKAKRFQFIDDHRDELDVGTMCEMLEVSPSGYYAWRVRQRR